MLMFKYKLFVNLNQTVAFIIEKTKAPCKGAMELVFTIFTWLG